MSMFNKLSPAYLRESGPYPLITGLTLMWDWGGANGFDVVTSSTQNMHSSHAFYSEHCKVPLVSMLEHHYNSHMLLDHQSSTNIMQPGSIEEIMHVSKFILKEQDMTVYILGRGRLYVCGSR